MSGRIEQRTGAVVAAVARFSQRHCWLVLTSAVLLAVAGGSYTARHVGINTDTTDMLAEHLPWRVAYSEFKAAFPYFSDNIVVVVDGATPDLALDSAAELSAHLARDPAHFGEIFNPGAEPFFRRQQFLYLDEETLAALIERISAAQALLGRLAADPGLTGLVTLLQDLATHGADDLPASATPFIDGLDAAIDGFLDGDPIPMSWQKLFSGDDGKASSRVLFTVVPELDYGSVLPAEHAIDAIREGVRELGLDTRPGVRVRLTGGAALAYDELSSVIRGAEQAALLALVMIAACLIAGMRSLSLVVATLVNLAIGLVFTATFATAAVGTLNMISVAFAALYVGLGVDFAIHLGMRYRELCGESERNAALVGAVRHIGPSLVLCALTTAIGFFAFIPTDYRGVAELGLISGAGMFVSLAMSFTVLPALLQALPAPRPRARPASASLVARPRRTTAIIGLAAVTAVLACFTLPYARFDLNPIHLNDPQAESVTTFEDLASDAEDPLYAIDLVLADRDALAAVAARLTALDSVAGVSSVADLVPDDQDAALAQVEDLRWSLVTGLELGTVSPIDATGLGGALQRLAQALATIDGNADGSGAALRALGHRIAALNEQLAAQPPEMRAAQLEELQDKLMRHFPSQVERLRDALEAEPFGVEDLPAALRARWVSDDGHLRLQIRPATDLDDNGRMAAFVRDVRSVVGERATGTPVINIEASRAVTTAFYQAFASAAAVIAALLWVIFRRLLEVLIVLVPLVLAGLLTTALAVVLDMPFNFANIIALPLLMGIGVDSALHIRHRYKSAERGALPLLGTSTARAVLFSALTTAASFGNLAVSPHAGTASMGMMLSIGLAMTLLCSLVVLPALLHRYVTPDAAPI